jgi:lipopolysaccharide transport system permease protein
MDRVGRTADLLVALSRSDLRVRYGRGRSQLVKWLVDPFALAGVYLILVTFVLQRSGFMVGLSLACAIVPFQLISMVVINGLDSVHIRNSIITNMSFPRTLIPVAAAATEVVALPAQLLLLVSMMAVYGVEPTVALLWLPVVLSVNLILAIAIAYPASLFGIWLRELRAFAISFVRMLFFLAPGLVTLDEITGRAHDLLRLNPLTGLIEAYRALFLYGHSPAAWELLYPLALAAVIAAVFVPIYRSEQRQFAKVI